MDVINWDQVIETMRQTGIDMSKPVKRRRSRLNKPLPNRLPQPPPRHQRICRRQWTWLACWRRWNRPHHPSQAQDWLVKRN